LILLETWRSRHEDFHEDSLDIWRHEMKIFIEILLEIRRSHNEYFSWRHTTKILMETFRNTIFFWKKKLKRWKYNSWSWFDYYLIIDKSQVCGLNFTLRFCFFFHKLVKITFGDQSLHLIFSSMTFLGFIPMIMVKKTECVRVPRVRVTFYKR
jgi:hypothetical protein